MKGITPFLWFDTNAEDAVRHYLGIFPNSEIAQVTHHSEGTPQAEGSVLTINFRLNGQDFTAMNGGPQFTFNEAVSFLVRCEDQAEIDHYWDNLLEGGTPMACGWLKDKFGVAWQIVPVQFFDMIDSKDREKAARVLTAMMTMVKFDIAGLQAAYNGD